MVALVPLFSFSTTIELSQEVRFFNPWPYALIMFLIWGTGVMFFLLNVKKAKRWIFYLSIIVGASVGIYGVSVSNEIAGTTAGVIVAICLSLMAKDSVISFIAGLVVFFASLLFKGEADNALYVNLLFIPVVCFADFMFRLLSQQLFVWEKTSGDYVEGLNEKEKARVFKKRSAIIELEK